MGFRTTQHVDLRARSGCDNKGKKALKSISSVLSEAALACQEGRLSKALKIYKSILMGPDEHDAALHGLGVIQLIRNHPLQAVILLQRGLLIANNRSSHRTSELQTSLLFALNSAATKAGENEDWARVKQLLKRAHELDPNQPHILSNMGIACLRSNDPTQAIKYSAAALALEAENANILNNHGTILQEHGLFEEACDFYKRALKLNPKHPNAQSNLGCIHHQLGELDRAETFYERHLKAFPGDSRVWVNLAGVLLSKGNWEKGWAAYHHRLDQAERIMETPPGLPLWQGAKHRVRHLIVVHEQGLGDTFQFSRFLKSLKNLCNIQEVHFSGPLKLHGLLRYSGLIESCWDPEGEKFSWAHKRLDHRDAWIPLMSLAPILTNKTTLKEHNHPYLVAQSKLKDLWESRLHDGRKPVVALHWQGNPDHEFTLSRGRSLPLSDLKHLLNVKDVQWLSLQKGPGSEQIDGLELRNYFHHAQDYVDNCWDFEETAAILMNCDLVITSDSGLAHLSAGLGRPTWLMLMKIPEWRWGLEGEKSSWYPTMRLFRQDKHGQWGNLIEKNLLPALQKWLEKRRNKFIAAENQD